MLGYSSDELLTIKFRDLVIKEKSQLALTDMIFNENGDGVVFNGKVVRNLLFSCMMKYTIICLIYFSD